MSSVIPPTRESPDPDPESRHSSLFILGGLDPDRVGPHSAARLGRLPVVRFARHAVLRESSSGTRLRPVLCATRSRLRCLCGRGRLSTKTILISRFVVLCSSYTGYVQVVFMVRTIYLGNLSQPVWKLLHQVQPRCHAARRRSPPIAVIWMRSHASAEVPRRRRPT